MEYTVGNLDRIGKATVPWLERLLREGKSEDVLEFLESVYVDMEKELNAIGRKLNLVSSEETTPFCEGVIKQIDQLISIVMHLKKSSLPDNENSKTRFFLASFVKKLKVLRNHYSNVKVIVEVREVEWKSSRDSSPEDDDSSSD